MSDHADYTLSSNLTLTIPAGATDSEGLVTITAVDNAVDAPDKEVTVSGTATNTQGVTAPSDKALVLEDDEGSPTVRVSPTVTLVLSDDAISEKGGVSTVTATLDRASSEATTVTVAVTPVDPATANDYTLSENLELTIPAGETDSEGLVTITAVDNAVDAPDKTVTVSATTSNSQGVTPPSDKALVLEDDEGSPTVTLVLDNDAISEKGGVRTVTATLDRASSAATTVTVSVAPVDPAVAGDYTLSLNLMLTIPADSLTSTGEVTITAVDNTVYEGDKAVTVSGAAANAQGVTDPDSVTLTITEDDTAPVVTVAAETAAVTEGEDAVFVLTRASADVTTPLAVDFTLADPDTVLAQEAPTTATIRANETTVRAVLATDDDSTHEPDATLTLTLTDGDLYDLGASSSATVTVRDNELAGQESDLDAAVTVAADRAVVTEGESAVFTLTRVGETTTEALVVTIEVAGGDGVLVGAPPTEATFGAGVATTQVTLATVDDEVDEPNAVLTLTVLDGDDYYPGVSSEDEVTVRDDDDAPTVTLVLTPPSIGEAGGKSTVTAELDVASSEDTTVTVAVAPVGLAVANDYTLSTNTTLTIAAGETTSTGTVTITAENNAVYEGDKQVTVSGTATNTREVSGPADETLTITEDDAAPGLSVADASVDEGDSGSATMTFTVTLTPAAVVPVTVDWTTSDGTATAGTDYTAGSGSLTFGTGEESKTFTVMVAGDEVDEPNETFTVTLTNESDATLTDGTATGTITDDDEAPEVTLVLTPASITEAGGKSTVTATLNHPSSEATTVTVSADPVDPAVEGDYTLSGSRLTIAAGEKTSTGEVTITAVNNIVYEGDKQVTVSGAATNDQGVTAPQAVTLTITEDDTAPVVTVVAETATVTEGEDAVFVLTRAGTDLAGALVVNFTLADPAAVLDQQVPTTATIPANETTVKVALATDDDNVDEPDAKLTLTLTDGAVYDLGSASSATITVRDNDPPGQESESDAAVMVASDGDVAEGADAQFTLTRTGTDLAGALVVNFTLADPAAVLDQQVPTTVTIPANETTVKVALATDDDDVDEPDAALTLTVTDGADYYPDDPSEATVTVEDNDEAPTVKLVLTRPSITEAGGKSTVTAALDHPSSEATTVTVSADPVDPAVEGDYKLVGSQLTIPAGETDSTGVVTITAVNNTVYEGDKQVTVSGTATNAREVSGPVDETLTITEDDTAPVVTVAAETGTVTEGENAVFVLTRAGTGIAAPLAVDFTLADPDTVLDQAAPATATIPANETTVKVTLATDDDAVHEEAATLTLTLTDGAVYDLGSASSATITVQDNEPPGQESESDAAVTVASDGDVAEGADAQFTLTRTGTDLAGALVVNFTLADPAAVLDQQVPATATIPANETTVKVTLATDDDNVDEPDAALTLTVTDGADYYPGEASEATVTVEDNDDAPTVTLVLTPASIGEAGGKSTVTATLDHPSSAATTVTVAAAPVSPAVVGDYRLSGSQLTIAANSLTSTGTVTITAENNEVNALDKEVTVSATAANTLGVTAPDSVTLMITDDELPLVTVAAKMATVLEGENAAFTLTREDTDIAGPLVVSCTFTDPATVLARGQEAPTTITIPAGRTTATVTLATENDQRDEPDATLTLTLFDGADYDLGTPSEAKVTVLDNDGPQVVTIRAVSEPAPEAEAAELEPGRTGDVPATITEGKEAVFELRRTGDMSAALTVELEVSERSERGGDMVPAASEGVRRVRLFAPGERESRFVVETFDDGVAEPDSELTVAVRDNGDFYKVGQPGTATLRVADAGGVSVLAQGRRAGAGALLRRHVERFSQLTSDVALGRLRGGHRVSTVDLKVDDEGVSANGEIAVALPLEWDGWGSLRYSDLGGTADGEVWDVYAGADYLSADGRTAYGVLTGYEPGRVTAEGVRLKASHMQFGVYGAHRLNETLTVDGALGWGRGKGDLSRVEGPYPATASYRSKRIAVRGGLTGDFGWGDDGLRVEPQIDLLYAEEDLGAFTDDMGGEAPGERLWLARLGFGPKVTRSLGENTTHGKLRVNLDTHNLESNEDRTEEVSVSVEVGHRWQIDERSSLDVSVSVDGLGSGWFSSGSVGLRYELRF